MRYRLASLILAAGESRRYGGNKLASAHPLYQNHSGTLSLLGAVVSQYQPVSDFPVLVVTGAHHDDIIADPNLSNSTIYYHDDWQQGMGSSLAAGCRYLASHFPQASHWLIGLGDQALVTTASLQPLVNASKQHSALMIASQWQDKVTAPAIFPAGFAPQLVQMQGDRGAAQLLREGSSASPPECLAVDHPEAAIDIDKAADWLTLPLLRRKR